MHHIDRYRVVRLAGVSIASQGEVANPTPGKIQLHLLQLREYGLDTAQKIIVNALEGPTGACTLTTKQETVLTHGTVVLD